MRLRVPAIVLLLAATVDAQGPTLRERVAEERTDISVTITADRPRVPFESVVQLTDQIVRATIGDSIARLSKDDRNIVTTYRLVDPRVLFPVVHKPDWQPAEKSKPLDVSQPGGTVTIDGFAATVLYGDLPRLRPGMDVIVLVSQHGGRYSAVDDDAIFQVSGSAIIPLTENVEHSRFAGMHVDSFIGEVLERRQSLEIENGQRETIPRRLARAGQSLVGGTTIPSGAPPRVAEVLRQADTLVRGVVGEPWSYLSEDQQEVYTDYPIENPIILYQSTLVTTARPGLGRIPAVTVTMAGGTVTMNGLTFTSRHDALPRLDSGTEGVFLLRSVGDGYHIAGQYYGAFGIAADRLTALTRKQGFATEYRDVPAAKAIEDMVGTLRARTK